jgi:hypothetical protein
MWLYQAAEPEDVCIRVQSVDLVSAAPGAPLGIEGFLKCPLGKYPDISFPAEVRVETSTGFIRYPVFVMSVLPKYDESWQECLEVYIQQRSAEFHTERKAMDANFLNAVASISAQEAMAIQSLKGQTHIPAGSLLFRNEKELEEYVAKLPPDERMAYDKLRQQFLQGMGGADQRRPVKQQSEAASRKLLVDDEGERQFF